MKIQLTQPLLTPRRSAGGRIEFVDVAKGLGIILVVWYHTNVTPNPVLNRFFMPLFFILSGMFFKPSDPPAVFLRKKFHELVAPFFFFLAISVAVEYFIHGLHHWNAWSYFTWSFERMGNVPLWFLLTLTYMSLMAYAIERCVTDRWLRFAIYGAILLFGLRGVDTRQLVPMYFTHACVMLPVFVTGYKSRLFLRRGMFSAPAFLILGVVGIAYSFHAKIYANIHRMIFTSGYLQAMAVAAAWVAVILFLTLLVSRWRFSRPLVWIGRNTLVVLGLHDLILEPLNEFVFPRFGIYPEVHNFTVNWIWTLLVSIVISALLAALSAPLRRAFPMVFGRNYRATAINAPSVAR